MMQCKNENQISAFLSGYPWNIGPVMLPSTLSLLEKAHLPAPSFSLLSNISLMNNINNNFNAITKSKSEADQNALCKVGCSQRAEIVEIDVEDRDGFGPLYQRNNKQIGIKNLRCFPNCGEFHKEKGFCGHSVTIRTNIKQGSANKSKYVAVAEFLHEEQPHRFNIGEIVSSSSIFALCRTKSDPCLPLILGSLVSKSNSLSTAESEPNSSSTLQSSSSSSDMMRFEFNKERRGWHYGWTANKHTCEMSHNLVCYLFETCESSDGVSSLRLIATTKSPSFIVFGRRRKRYTVLPTAPTAPPKTRVKKQKREESEDETDEGCPSSPTPALSTSSGDSTPTFSSTQPIVNAPKLQEAIDLPFMIHVSTLTNPFAQTPIVDDPANNQQIKKRRFEDSTASSLSSEAQDLKNNINEMAKILCMLSTCGGSATLA